jgi:Protein of unknown function (DUF1194)
MMRHSVMRGISAAVIGLSLVGQPAAKADTNVDLELVLAVDISGSMDPDEQELQRAGYVAALRHPDVAKAVKAGPLGRIAITYFEWAGPDAHRVAVPWTVVDGAPAFEAFAARVAAAPINRMRGTSISTALYLSRDLFRENPFIGERMVVDVSGDGPNNMGPPVLAARDQLVADGIVINGLPIMLKQGGSGFGSINDLDVYYRDCVIGGVGSFTVPVRERGQLADAIRRKLVLEIAGLTPGPEARILRASTTDCLIGERQRRNWMDP